MWLSGVATAVGVLAVGAAVSSGAGSPQGVLDVYSSLPLHGASRAESVAIVNGARLALAQAGGRAGQFKVKYISLDDSVAATGQWSRAQTTHNARLVARDPKAVYYIGDLDDGASEVSIPILNIGGVAQVSPTNTAVGLTTNYPGSLPGEPQKYYPTGVRNYLRISANDWDQAAALLATLKAEGCQRVAIAYDDTPVGAGVADDMELNKAKYGLDIVSNTGLYGYGSDYSQYASAIAPENPDCFLFTGTSTQTAVQVTKAVAAAIPGAKLYGSSGTCSTAFTDPAQGGIPATLDDRFECTPLPLGVTAYAGGQAFLAAYKAKYGVTNPDPYAIYGYEAMKLGLDTIRGLGPKGAKRSPVVRALFATRNRDSVLGTYSFDQNGDTTLRAYGVYRVVGQAGVLSFVKNAFAP